MNTLNQLFSHLNQLSATPTMPVMFIGHGSPMNAISDNHFVRVWREIGEHLQRNLPKPKAILSVSAHWLTRGETQVLTSPQPKTIHDFYGFPDLLFEQQYPAEGAEALALQTIDLVNSPSLKATEEWGLDHGTWSVLLPMFPQADIPVYQISIDYLQPPTFHYQLAQQLQALRQKEVLILTSGNVVHNLQQVRWDNPAPFDWAVDFNHQVETALLTREDATLVNFDRFGALGRMAHPTYDHYLPLMYALGLREETDEIYLFNNEIDLASVSMLSLMYLPQKAA